jgi:signal transduction histidine kinase
MLGLALVAGGVSLLALGTAYGINAYYNSVKLTYKKLDELKAANELIGTIASLDQGDMQDDSHAYLAKVRACSGPLDGFRKAHAVTVESGYDPNGGEKETRLADTLDKQLQALVATVEKVSMKTETGLGSSPPGLRAIQKDESVRQAYDAARLTAEHIRIALNDDIAHSGSSSSAAIRRSAWWVSFALGWSIVLVLTMLYYFHVWMFAPIRELQAGVQRVHAGRFDQPIRLTSGDELQELADEFNTMVARLHAVYADLARQVNERSRQLVRSERMVSVGFLAAGVAHEINNPLASILFCSEALERRLQDVLNALATAGGPAAGTGALLAEVEVLTRYLKMIQQEALRCKDITQKLLDFSRTGERRKEPADITGLVSGVLEVARHLPSSRGKVVAFEPTGYIVAPVNAQDLKSVILNLVVNALDSMDDGGRLEITSGTAAGYAELVFTDTGCGMTADVLQNIFEPFYTKSRTGKGTGLGLFISHQIVDQHGGTITAASAGPGTGATFTVRIPLEVRQGGTGGYPIEAEPEPPVPPMLPFPGRREAA